jgi:hypothetical protein
MFSLKEKVLSATSAPLINQRPIDSPSIVPFHDFWDREIAHEPALDAGQSIGYFENGGLVATTVPRLSFRELIG